MEDEWEEEEQLVVAELSGMIDSDVLSKCGTCKMVDVDGEQPVMQVGRYVFAGEYEDCVGTCVIFEEDRDQGPALKYKCHTMKKLMLQRTFLSERKEGEPAAGGIELLSLNEGEMSGRSSTVCHYTLDPRELQRIRAAHNDEDGGVSDESDAADTDQGSTNEDSTINGTEPTENAAGPEPHAPH
ncbi:general transcription factor 3C polypeptide 6 [Brachyhypopomus gauderio]|uniref:general transcription factor 3C polypeptide 6 n=1 Tax=Brachyhypopomus gauderio TaxID=698409 RepID=UPI0040417906